MFVWSLRSNHQNARENKDDEWVFNGELVLVAYLFDTHCGLLIDPSKNVSKSAGLERHIRCLYQGGKLGKNSKNLVCFVEQISLQLDLLQSPDRLDTLAHRPCCATKR